MGKLNSIVRQIIVECAHIYQRTFVDYDYLVCSSAFVKSPYYIIDAHEDNYEHLTGVTSKCSPREFFDKCMNNTLLETDFEFIKKNQTEGMVRNFVKLKTAVLPKLDTIFNSDTIVEESFIKGKVVCSFATATDDFTLGFSIGKTAKPKSLLKGNFIQNRDNHLDLVIRRPHGQQLFSDVIVGNKAMLEKHLRDIKPLLSDSLIAQTCIYRRIRLSRSRGC